jgi:hypothetical protein
MAAVILGVLAAGPVPLTVIMEAVHMKRRRALRVVCGLRSQGLVKRLGLKGWSTWALKTYRGPKPKVVHPAHLAPRRSSAGDTRHANGHLATSWWLDLADRQAFVDAAALRAHDAGWRRANQRAAQ